MMKKIILLLCICIISLMLPHTTATETPDVFFPPEERVVLLNTGDKAVAIVDGNGDLSLHYFDYDSEASLYSTAVTVDLMSDVKMIASGVRTFMVLQQDGTLWVYKYHYDREDFVGPLKLTDGVSKVVARGAYNFLILYESGTLFDIEADYVSSITFPVPGEYIMTQIDTDVADACSYAYLKGNEVLSVSFGQSELVKVLDFSDGVKIWQHNRAYFVLTQTGDLWSWGYNVRGQLGNGGQYDSTGSIAYVGDFQDGYVAYPIIDSTPTKILSNIADVWFGSGEIRAIDYSNSVWQWGDGENIMAYVEKTGDRSYVTRDIQYPEGFPNCLGYFPRSVTPDQWISSLDFDTVLYDRNGGIWVDLNDNGDPFCIIQGQTPSGPMEEPTLPTPPAEPSEPAQEPGTSDSPTGFDDIPDNHYCADPVIWAVEQGITSGTSATTFSPDAVCTRAQAVTFLWRAAGSPAPKTTVTSFSDVSEDAYYYNAVLWAVENRITVGTSERTFSPDGNCTRSQIVTFLWRFMEPDTSSGANTFTDVSSGDYFYLPVCWAVTQGITVGMGSNRFAPNDFCTRGQIVTFLYRALKDA